MGSLSRLGKLDPARWRRIEAILDPVLELPAERVPTFLDQACAGDPELREQVADLLAAETEAGAGTFLEQAAAELAAPLLEHREDDPGSGPVEGAGRRIGPWRIEREIGRGGMGAVYLAERADGAFEQRVALKLIKRGLDTDEILARFRRERQILARLEHPNIARLLDGGATEDGLPWFAMEYVEGEPITAWRDHVRPDLETTLRLFLQVCGAVRYAHQNLVVHRDLKPGNILVTCDGVAKLLDFGIARLLDTSDGPETTMGDRRLTPHYAAPEQIRGDPPTTATDVFALGVILYELLTGGWPHGRPDATPEETRRAVLEDQPVPPSAGLARRGGNARPIAWRSRLQGDLDNIVLKALRQETVERFPSADALVEDLERYLEGRPVRATRPTWRYRARKFVQRNRVAVAAGAVVALSLVVGLVGVGWQARVAARERDRAVSEAKKANAINEFILWELLEAPTPEHALGRALTVVEVLENASRSIPHAFPSEPATEAAVRMTLARTYAALGELDVSRRHAEEARRLLERAEGSPSPELLDARTFLGQLAADQGRYVEARTELEGVLALEQQILGAEHPATVLTRAQIGRVSNLQGEYSRAEATLRGALATLGDQQEEHWRLAVEIRWWLADALYEQFKVHEAEAVCRQALEIQQRHLGSDHPDIALTLGRLARALGRDLRFTQAEEVLRRVVDMRVRLHGENHPATAEALADLGVELDHLLRYQESARIEERALDIYRRTLGAEHPRTLRVMRNLALSYRRVHRFREAEPILLEVFRSCQRALGEAHPQTIQALRGIQNLRVEQGRLAEARDVARRVARAYDRVAARQDAEPEILNDYAEFLITVDPQEARDPRRALEIAERAVAATGRRDYITLRTLGLVHGSLGRPRDAIATLREALALPEGTRSWTTEEELVRLLEEHGTAREVETFLLEFLERQRAARGPEDWIIAKTLRLLALHYRKTRRMAEAERRARESLDQLSKNVPEDYWELGRAKSELGMVLVERRAFAEAESLLIQGFTTLEADEASAPRTLQAHDWLVRLYETWGKPAKAKAWRDRRPRAAAP